MLEIRLFGSPEVTVDSAHVEVDTRKAIAMLAYLAIEHSADREALAALFWADSSPERARATLRRTLSALRGGVGTDVIGADRNRVELVTRFRSDVDQFDSAIEETRSHGHDANEVCERCIAPLSRAADLYRGDFLGAFAVRDAPDFEDWARSMTESYRLRAGDAYARLAMALAGTGEYNAAIEAAGKWIDLDELHEPAYRLLMLLYAWAGDRPGAIQAYRDCVAVLDRELGVPPLEETTELFEAILDEDLPPAPAVKRPVQVHRLQEPPSAVIGRGEEMKELRRLIETIAPPCRLAVISGASWMGKSRMIEYLVQVCNDLDVPVVSGRAFSPESNLPYGVATQLLDGLVSSSDGVQQDLPAWALTELAKLDPKLFPGGGGEATGNFGELRIREAFLELVKACAGSGPTVLTIDDAQWLDAASANLLSYVYRRASKQPLLVVVTTREVGDLHPAMREIAGELDNTVELGPLTAPSLVDSFPDTDLTAIVSATGGIPLLVKDALDSDGVVSPEAESVQKYMESRRRRLSDLASQVMAAAAVLDGMCDAQLLRDTSGRTEEEVVDAVEELMSAGLLREHEDGRLGFTLDVLEAMSYESTSLVRRRLLHKRAGEALMAKPRVRSDARLATAAAAQLQAAGSEEAASWYQLAGDLARDVYANDEAVASYEMAIALGHSDVGRLRLALGELAMDRGEYQTAKQELRTASSQCTGAALALVEHRIGSLNRILGRFELAEESFARARADHPNPSDLYADWALLKHRTGNTDTAVSLAASALDAARGEGDPLLVARALNILAVVDPDPERASRHLDDAMEMAASSEPARIAALNNKAHLVAGGGDLDQAIGLVEEAVALADRTGYRHHQAALLNHLADLHHQAGRVAEAEESLTRAVTLFAGIDSGDWEPEVWLLSQW